MYACSISEKDLCWVCCDTQYRKTTGTSSGVLKDSEEGRRYEEPVFLGGFPGRCIGADCALKICRESFTIVHRGVPPCPLRFEGRKGREALLEKQKPGWNGRAEEGV